MTSFLSEASFKANVVPIEGRGSHNFVIRDNYKEYINNLWINMKSEIDKRRDEKEFDTKYKEVNYYDFETQSKT
jgi:hypothetical protein